MLAVNADGKEKTMETRHTPGPWPMHKARIADHYCIGERAPYVAVAKTEADARLVAAAPDLLEALKELRYACTDKAESMADAAIAKATGFDG